MSRDCVPIFLFSAFGVYLPFKGGTHLLLRACSKQSMSPRGLPERLLRHHIQGSSVPHVPVGFLTGAPAFSYWKV